ncbi:hypothetical protein BGZ52_008036, partial [Haplosporangium bisporale]
TSATPAEPRTIRSSPASAPRTWSRSAMPTLAPTLSRCPALPLLRHVCPPALWPWLPPLWSSRWSSCF